MSTIKSGLERWLSGHEGPRPRGSRLRLGVLAHAASIDAGGRHVLERLATDTRLRVERVFAPEHGLFGHEQDMERVADSRDVRGTPVVSLYGSDASSLRPPQDALDGLDAVVCDLQDVGARYYTFVYTMAFLMEAARDADLPVWVLDRPNPIGGVRVEGPVLQPAMRSFVGHYELPVRHGMTVAELAGMFNEAFGIGCRLGVVPMGGWRRGMEFEDTGLPWVPPSPNMPAPSTARVYPGGCLIEGTALSEGRGTTTPFELVGAPWLNGEALARDLRALGIPGVAFRAASFRPMFQKHAGRACGGVQVLVRESDRFEPFRVYWELIRLARAQDPGAFAWRSDEYEFVRDRPAIDLLLGRADLRPCLEQRSAYGDVEPMWSEELRAFQSRRAQFLIYD